MFSIKRFVSLMQLDKEDVLSIYFFAILSGLVQLSLPVGIQSIVGFVQGASMVTSLYVLIALVVLGVLLVGLFQVSQMRITEKIQQKIFTRMAFQFTEKIPKIDLVQVDRYYLPEKINRFFETLTVQKGFSKLLLDIPASFIQIIFGLVLLAFYHPFFVFLGLFLSLALYLLIKLGFKKGLETSLEESNYKYAFVAWLEEMAGAIKAFKFSKGSSFELAKSDDIVVNYLKYRTSHFKVLMFQYKGLVWFKVILTAFLLSLGVYLLIEQKLNIGEFIAAEIIIINVIDSIEKIIKNLDTAYDVATAVEKLMVVTTFSEENEGKLEFNPTQLQLQLRNFSFAFAHEEPLMQGINLELKQGALVCISGEEAAGKTTLLKALSTIYTNHSGAYLINNIPSSNYALKSLRNKIGMFFYKSELFSASVFDNICMGRDITPESIIALADRLGFQQIFHGLPAGLSTEVEITGRQMNRSMAQKILILRCLANDPALIFMDDPFQGLEPDCKNKLIEYLHSIKKNKIVVLVTNDKLLAEKADARYLLKDGNLTTLNA